MAKRIPASKFVKSDVLIVGIETSSGLKSADLFITSNDDMSKSDILRFIPYASFFFNALLAFGPYIAICLSNFSFILAGFSL